MDNTKAVPLSNGDEAFLTLRMRDHDDDTVEITHVEIRHEDGCVIFSIEDMHAIYDELQALFQATSKRRVQ